MKAAILILATLATSPADAMIWPWERHHARHHHHRSPHHHERRIRTPEDAKEPTVDCAAVRAAVDQLNSTGAVDQCTADIGIFRCSPGLNRQLSLSDPKQTETIARCMREGRR